mgnify:CR=1 FL=1
MANVIIIDENWTDKVLEIAEKFNKFAKQGSLRMLSSLIDEAFDLASNDENPQILQFHASKFLQRVRAVNQNMISPYVSELIDAKVARFYHQSDEYMIPGQVEPAKSTKNSVIDVEEEIQEEGVKSDDHQESTGEHEEEDNLLNWDLQELMKYKIIKDVSKISYDQVDSKIKKCCCADGRFDKQDEIWKCDKCGAPYHQNCVKIVGLLEGKCRICDHVFLVEDEE